MKCFTALKRYIPVVVTLSLMLTVMPSPTPAHASENRRIIVSPSMRSMPKRYRKQHIVCGHMHVRDNNSDGVPEFAFAWSDNKVAHIVEATWDGTRVVPNEDIPRIAAVATRGAIIGSHGEYDRQICAIDDKRIWRLTTSDDHSDMRSVYRKDRMTRRLRTRFDADDFDSISAVFIKRVADAAAEQAAEDAAQAAAAAKKEAALWQARIDAWQTDCTHGTTVQVQHGNTVETWICKN